MQSSTADCQFYEKAMPLDCGYTFSEGMTEGLSSSLPMIHVERRLRSTILETGRK